MSQTMNQTPTPTTLAPLAPISRSEARAAGLLTFFTGKPCRHGHLAGRYVSNWNCIGCQQGHAAAYEASEKRFEYDRQRTASGYLTAKQARRRAGQRCPGWVSSDPALVQEMQAIYAQAQQLGEGWHVDHVVPLVGKNTLGDHVVSGLHVPWNLRVVPADQNIAKGSRFDPDAPLEYPEG